MAIAVQLNNVTKSYGKTTAVQNISFTIDKGTTVAILGPNGAGKTTTISMMLGLLEPTSGDVRLFEKNPKEIVVREKIGAMLQDVSLIDKLKVHEVIKLFRSYYKNPLSIEELVEITGLEPEDLTKWATKLSGGQRRRVAFALALAGNPDLVFLDEPTVGLDVTARRKFWEKIDILKASGKTIIFSTHYLEEADDVAERIILFNKGEIIADGKPAEIKQKFRRSTISFQTDNPDALPKLKALPNVLDCYMEEERICIITEETDAVLETIYKENFIPKDMQIEHGRLEEVFEHLTSNQGEVS